MVILVLLLGTVLLTGSMNVAHPFLVAARMRKANDTLEQQIMRLKLQNQNDLKAIHALEEPDGIKQAARNVGFILPNENRLQVP